MTTTKAPPAEYMGARMYDQYKYVCPYCDCGSDNTEDLLHHMQLDHNSEYKRAILLPGKEKKELLGAARFLESSEEAWKRKRRPNLLTGYRRYALERYAHQFMCPYCDNVFAAKKDITSHCKRAHNCLPAEDAEVRISELIKSNAEFLARAKPPPLFRKHRRYGDATNALVCPFCDTAQQRLTDLKIHVEQYHQCLIRDEEVHWDKVYQPPVDFPPDGKHRIGLLQALFILAWHWRASGGSGVGLPYAVAFWRWWNFRSIKWNNEKDQELVRKLGERMIKNGGELKFGGNAIRIMQQYCGGTGMYVHGGFIKNGPNAGGNWDSFPNGRLLPDVGIDRLMYHYKTKNGPSNRGEGVFSATSAWDCSETFLPAFNAWMKVRDNEPKKKNDKEG